MTCTKSKEDRLVESIFNLPKEQLVKIQGKPKEVLKLIESKAIELRLFMNIGPAKGKVVVDQIRKSKPKIMIELGGYVGYSAILFAKELVGDPEAKYYSFEVNEYYAGIANRFIQLAGLSNKIEIILGKASKNLIQFKERIQQNDKFRAIDFVFIDHWKDMYVPDIRVLETLNLIAPGTIIAADNILYPGVPGYVKYVQGSPEYKRYHNIRVKNVNGKEYTGRWNILQCVNIVQSGLGDDPSLDYDKSQTRKQGDDDSVPYIIKDTFIKETLDFYKMLTSMHQFIKEIKSPYLAINDDSNAVVGSLSIQDKNKIDEEFNVKIQQMYKKLTHLETYESKRQELTNSISGGSSGGGHSHGGWLGSILGADDEPSDQEIYYTTMTIHRKQILRFLMETLNHVNKEFDALQHKRLTREKQLNLLNFQNFLEDEDLNDEFADIDQYSSTQLAAVQDGEHIEQEPISQQQLQELELENSEFLTMKTNQFQQVEKVQKSILDIINIQNELSFKLTSQGETIGNLMETHSQVEIEVEMGNKTLQKATKKNKRGANLLVILCVTLGFFILLVDFISF
ncbi:UFE1 [[Candida] subhashii]|uniref:catechol O-methyltransferase n=1 Tax=[Candida] subhashii TaxID=561895 RepID=A0A8J5QGC8_9ASCO|nr:UFE1 [[Candida] subhashii]KAG7664056.1 UFE1 [[Candida] subhashii]